MTITQITIKGVKGDVEIHAADYGAQILYADVCIELARGAHDHERWIAAQRAALAIYGADRHGRPNATNSMIHSVLTEIERVAGC